MTDTIDFQVFERVGSPIFPVPEDLTQFETFEQLRDYVDGTEISNVDLTAFEGHDVLVPTLGGYGVAKIEKSGDSWVATSGGMTFFLQYERDDFMGISCWFCVGQGNLDAIKKLEITR